ncbi:MAG: poly[(R)-3-hydroxyalkanoate] polymerase subunit PhaC [Pseudonocardiales bacterium]|nr:poly[(R)-3-hydroxyalkanoate] polymerase subunit PhaC [Pseudonocardiales bacterium]
MSDDRAELVGAPIDLLLTDAARGSLRRFAPDTTLLRWGGGLSRRPRKVAGRLLGLCAEYLRIAGGSSRIHPEPRDRRFTDPAWSGNPLLRRTMQAHLATARVGEALIEDAWLAKPDRLRLEFLVSNLSDALAPSNAPLLNPRALRAVVDTGGANFTRGIRRLVADLAEAPRIPSMVDQDAFTVGRTVAATPGAVVARTDVFELIQYTPSTERVRAVPLVIVPPTINKYYAVDMAPGRSLVEYLVGQGHQVFIISWRNPDVRHARWGFDTYGQAILDAIEAARSVTGAPSVALLALCSGAVLTSMVFGHLADVGQLDRVAAAAMSVAVLDQHEAGITGALLTPPGVTWTAGHWPRCSPGCDPTTWCGTTGSSPTCSATPRSRSTCCSGTPTPPG